MRHTILIFLALNIFSIDLKSQDQPFIKQVETGMLPVFKDNFRPQISISPQLAYFSFGDLNSSGLGYGVELAMQCPLACTKKNYIRQQVSFLAYQDSERDYDYWTASINPEYRLLVTPEFEFAIGPSVGYFNATGESNSSSGITGGITTSATVHLGKFMIAISPRYLVSKDIALAEGDFSQNNFQGIFKLGYKL